MRASNLFQILDLSKDVVAEVNISDLIKSGLVLNEDYEIKKDFLYSQPVKNDGVFSLDITRSNGWFGNIEIHFAFFIDTSESDENIHISQEVRIVKNKNGKLQFVCPILGGENLCSTLYLRNDFPLFGSDEGLNVGWWLKSARRD